MSMVYFIVDNETCSSTIVFAYYFHMLYQSNSFLEQHCVKYLSVFGPNAGKHGPGKTPHLDIFRAMQLLFFLIRRFDLSTRIFFFFDPWIFCHLLSHVQVSGCFLSFYGCCEWWLPWVSSSTCHVMDNMSHKYKLKKHFLRKHFSVCPIKSARYWSNESE